MGLNAGLAVAAIFHMQASIESIVDHEVARQPHWGGYEIKDILYLMPLNTLLDGLHTFLILAVIGAPLFAAWSFLEYRQLKQQHHRCQARPTSRLKSSGTGVICH